MTETPAAAVNELLGLFERLRIHVWLDGGWAVDALLGEQTRPHLDIVIEQSRLDIATLCTRFAIPLPAEYR